MIVRLCIDHTGYLYVYIPNAIPNLIRLKWRLLAVTNLKGGTDSLFFIYDDDHPGGAGRGPEDLAMLSLNRLEDRNH